MTFRGGIDKPENLARTGGGGGGRIAVGGGVGTLLLVGLFLLMGGDPSQLGGLIGSDTQQQPQQQSAPGELEHCKTSDDANRYADCRVEFTGISLNQVWNAQLPRQADIPYTKPNLVVFNAQTSTGCGVASSATGPFYCPADHTAYFDVSFFDSLERYGGQNAPFAQEYIVAHEFGHHIQSLEGTLGLSDYNDPGPDSMAVKIELQADCYAGIWGHFADKGEDAFLEPITQSQVEQAIDAARAVGDDNIQQRAGRDVNPESFTHGTSKQRQEAFLQGYRTGSMASCDYLDRNAYS
ncbi:KPN_02809 family neutral zinc metallopeptidase [Corynebacterium pseudopelargi]|uniref:Neutral zinc metallopeptidase n=1 Tax=Corynebacterium pseudopelargi TaxID=2080757 RepID=A0A3G6ITU2_9CORY|nr:neutral zinc metallopeptidase [Corynebacterium pseudopelargi]AZA09169.1 Putative neutral zinc metallopeptidase [Corynebacterium pseudopelargi]